MQEVILVDEQDQETGRMEKLKAHQLGLLHRAFSIFIFNDQNEWLLQRRAMHKYHSGGLWTNACCSHPAPGEKVLKSASNRLFEEMGFRAPLYAHSALSYHARLANGLIEYEFDHILLGSYNGEVKPNPDEVMDYKWVSYTELQQDVVQHPEAFTVWFLKIYQSTTLERLDKDNVRNT